MRLMYYINIVIESSSTNVTEIYSNIYDDDRYISDNKYSSKSNNTYNNKNTSEEDAIDKNVNIEDSYSDSDTLFSCENIYNNTYNNISIDSESSSSSLL
jgi:hypothetical protein